MNKSRLAALCALTVQDELKEIEAAFGVKLTKESILGQAKGFPRGIVKLQRTYNMMGTRYWRVNCPGHPNHESDLSIEGLKEWGIL